MLMLLLIGDWIKITINWRIITRTDEGLLYANVLLLLELLLLFILYIQGTPLNANGNNGTSRLL